MKRKTDDIVGVVSALAETALLAPGVSPLGLFLWDTEFVRENTGNHTLRVYIDKTDGSGVSLDDCETVSNALEPELDRIEDIFPAEGYTFEVSSAGAERRLRRESDFARFIGSFVEVSLYKARDGAKSFLGTLVSYRGGDVVIKTEKGGELVFENGSYSQVRLRIKF